MIIKILTMLQRLIFVILYINNYKVIYLAELKWTKITLSKGTRIYFCCRKHTRNKIKLLISPTPIYILSKSAFYTSDQSLIQIAQILLYHFNYPKANPSHNKGNLCSSRRLFKDRGQLWSSFKNICMLLHLSLPRLHYYLIFWSLRFISIWVGQFLCFNQRDCSQSNFEWEIRTSFS